MLRPHEAYSPSLMKNPLVAGVPPSAVDVVVPIYRDVRSTLDCLALVLRHSQDRLGRLIAINDASPEPSMTPSLALLAQSDPRVTLLVNETSLGLVKIFNRALAMRRGDVVLLNSDTRVTDGWLDELAAVAWTDERTACASPLSNNATLLSVPRFRGAAHPDDISAEVVRRATQGLPRSTVVPTCAGSCLYLRGPVLDLVGDFDTVFSPGYNEDNDWIMRAQLMGFVARRANRAFVYHLGAESFEPQRDALEIEHAELLSRRHPHCQPQVQHFCGTLEGHLAAHAVRAEATGKLRVALDLRALTNEKAGTTIYGIRLAEALAAAPEIDLTLAMRTPLAVQHVRARVLNDPKCIDDVEVIHKPSQVFDRADLEMLYNSPAHLVLSYQDLIAYHAQGLWLDPAQGLSYRRMSFHTLHACQRVIALSEVAAREIVDTFGISPENISVVHHGVESSTYRARTEDARALLDQLGVFGRFFLAVGTDYPHKNLDSLIAAWRVLKEQWRSAESCPGLVLAGNAYDGDRSLYRRLASSPIEGTRYLGEVDDSSLIALLQEAEALVFPSVYEGFGLPPLEAMATGTPVIAMPLSSVLEVCGGAALYPETLDVPGLAAVMRMVSCDQGVRARLIEAGRNRAADFSMRTSIERTIAAYRSAILSPSPQSLLFRANSDWRVRAQAADAEVERLQHDLAEINNSVTFRVARPIFPVANWIRRRFTRTQ